MSFSSLDFAVFLAVVYALYRVLPHRGQNRMLLLASYVFYGWWDWRFLALIVFSTTVDFVVGAALGRTADPQRRRRLLIVSLVANLGVLGFFKYFNFFAGSLAELAGGLGFELGWTTLHIVLPVGISFYTFQTLSYTVDVYRERIRFTSDYFDYALYVAFFPQLVAGPIERAVHLLPEIQRPRQVELGQSTRGAFLILQGLFKKIVIADGVGPSVDAVFAASSASGADVAGAVLLFALQIYGDFSGYSDVARGVAKLLGFELMVNFRTPYFSQNPQEFWRRWHISLSTWLRDYLYVPLGGNRDGTSRTYRNLSLTMLLGGLWHGAAWNFVLWGAYHGALLSLHRALTGQRPDASRVPRAPWRSLPRMAFFFALTCYGWLLFRAGSWHQVVSMTGALLSGIDPSALSLERPPLPALFGIPVLLIMDLAEYRADTANYYRPWPEPLRALLYAVLLVLTLMGTTNAPADFIYFQF